MRNTAMSFRILAVFTLAPVLMYVCQHTDSEIMWKPYSDFLPIPSFVYNKKIYAYAI